MKKRTIMQSLVCGAVLLGSASLSYGTGTAILSENFESGIGSWNVGDSNPNPGASDAYWGTVTAPFGSVTAAHSGSGMAYCAAIGYGDIGGLPAYKNYMSSYMSKSVNLTGVGTASLTFWFTIPSIESGFDTFSVYVDGTKIWSTWDAHPNWTQVTLSLNAFTDGSHTITFEFDTDSAGVAEGAYVDDITVTAYPWKLWWVNSSGSVAPWVMDGTNGTSLGLVNVTAGDPNWKLVTTGDLNNDGLTDLLWQNQKDGRLSAWLMQDETHVAQTPVLAQVHPNWKLVGAADFNGDHQTDLLFQNTDGRLSVWFMNGTTQIGSAMLTPAQVDPKWKIAAVGEVNADGQTELVWQDTAGRLSIWYMTGTTNTSAVVMNPAQVDPKWKIVGMADVNQDGHLDLVWQHTDGTLSYWLMEGSGQSYPRIASGYLNPINGGSNWKAVGAR